MIRLRLFFEKLTIFAVFKINQSFNLDCRVANASRNDVCVNTFLLSLLNLMEFLGVDADCDGADWGSLVGDCYAELVL